MNALVGVALLALNVLILYLLRPREGRTLRVIEFPGMWVVVSLVLTSSFAVSLALVITGI
jgi:hypothetical protein